MAVLQTVGLTKSYNGATVVSQVNLEIASGEFFSLLGPSGCGKTTTLRLLAGLAPPDEGQILVDGNDIVQLPPERRNLGIVFQNYAIFPHMNVADNIAFGLRMRKIDKATIRERVHSAVRQVGLTGFEHRFQRELSGGQQQRVALARVLVTEPRLLLLDEPLSALDKNLREEMKYWIKELQRSLGITTVYVTHDQSEALTMSDRIGVMNNGRMVQIGTPTEIYERPLDLFVATFIGHANLLDATVMETMPDAARLTLGDGICTHAPARRRLTVGQRVKLVVRPENVLLDAADDCNEVRVPAVIEAKAYQGALVRYQLSALRQSIVAEVQNRATRAQYDVGSGVMLCWRPESTEALPVS